MILVTGGSGFIGSNLVEELISKGHEVRVLDNLDTGKQANIDGFKVDFVQGDIRNLKTVRESLKDVECVYHQAALGSVPRSMNDPIESTQVNVIGTLNVLRAAQDSGVEKIVYASSSSVYGGIEESPKREDMEMVPISVYGVTKVMNEYYFRVFYGAHGIKSLGLRYFNVFGPRQSPDSDYAAAIPKFIKMIMNGEQPVIYGDGEQTRDFTFVKDVVKANMLAMDAAKCDGSAYNIAGGKEVTINSLIHMINGFLGKGMEPKYLDPRPGDPKHSLADISRARDDLGYQPDYTIEDGLKLTIEWLKGG